MVQQCLKNLFKMSTKQILNLLQSSNSKTTNKIQNIDCMPRTSSTKQFNNQTRKKYMIPRYITLLTDEEASTSVGDSHMESAFSIILSLSKLVLWVAHSYHLTFVGRNKCFCNAICCCCCACNNMFSNGSGLRLGLGWVGPSAAT